MSEVLNHQLPQHLIARRRAKRRESGTRAIAIALFASCLVGAGLLVNPINRIRKERQFLIDPESVKGLPPDIALLGKLGTFRALAIDWASIRADRLKEEGKHYEALQLHQTICALAPRFPKVWANAAWNMAYNISVAQYTPQARWQWVRNGIRILRDKGMLYNPRAATLYRELSWIYWHKIGDFLDDEHLNYKRALAVEMEGVLGAPPIAIGAGEYTQWFRGIAAAPHDLDEMIESDAAVARLVSDLREVGLEPDELLLAFVARRVRPERPLADLLEAAPDLDDNAARRIELFTDPQRKEAIDRLLATVRSKVLRERYRLDPEWMLHLMGDLYGPLDWRNAFSHALYWASLGDELSRGRENVDIHAKLNNARFVLFSLQNLVTRGRITLWPDFEDPFASYIELTPDTRFIPYLYDTYMRMGKEYFSEHPDFREGTPGPVFMNGFVTNMQIWIQLLYLEGGESNMELARNFYVYLRRNNPHPNGSTQERYLKTLDEFVLGELLRSLETYKAAAAFVRSFIQRGLKNLSLGLTRPGLTSMRRARQAYDFWMIDTQHDINERRQMQPFPRMVADEIEMYIRDPRFAPLYKSRLWENLPLQQRQRTYDRLRTYFDRLCVVQSPPWSTARAFPQPPGMEEFRGTEFQQRGRPQDDVERGEKPHG